MRQVAWWIVVIVAGSFAGLHCGVNIFPASYDAQLGANLDQEIRNNPREYPILNNETVRSAVQRMVDDIIRSPLVEHRGRFAYRVTIINDPNTLNAFCTPGGYIYVYTGLMKAIDNEATLAAILGHEIAHAERRHATKRMTKALGAQLLLDIALGKNPSRTTELAANLFVGLALLKNSRDDEAESDEYSFRYLQSTRWYPGALGYFFEKVKGRSGGAIERLLSTHPLPEDRIKANAQRVQAANLPPPTEENLRSQPYQELKRLLP
ncbi:MAG: M48 family metalloprotease [Bacteroidota bacterium]|nr:M48 family metalloprotease [Candidatus Kapabacteria bacterium]MCS7302124.1 M48 family metalloprotease [Candidatus Kapabacteria bacterium]MDW8074645.1 M48 family metalloprotease [Bacteroidota bacterium]MDW8270879.1 M48 family metalloprotease [Bacteroidota bacterium]